MRGGRERGFTLIGVTFALLVSAILIAAIEHEIARAGVARRKLEEATERAEVERLRLERALARSES